MKKCQNCGATNSSSKDVLRQLGWIIWDGTTLGGKNIQRIYCHVCAGRTEHSESGEPVGYNAECFTCGASAVQDEERDDLTEDEAEGWSLDHRCEPRVDVIPPKKHAVVT